MSIDTFYETKLGIQPPRGDKMSKALTSSVNRILVVTRLKPTLNTIIFVNNPNTKGVVRVRYAYQDQAHPEQDTGKP